MGRFCHSGDVDGGEPSLTFKITKKMPLMVKIFIICIMILSPITVIGMPCVFILPILIPATPFLLYGYFKTGFNNINTAYAILLIIPYIWMVLLLFGVYARYLEHKYSH